MSVDRLYLLGISMIEFEVLIDICQQQSQAFGNGSRTQPTAGNPFINYPTLTEQGSQTKRSRVGELI